MQFLTPGRMLSCLLPMAGVASLIACGGGRQTPTPTPSIGSFDFLVRAARGEVRGVVHVLRDTVLVEVEYGFCHRVFGQGDARYIRYACEVRNYNAFGIIIDRRDMSLGSTWSVSFSVSRTRQVCVDRDMSGKCLRTVTQPYEDIQHQGGKLQLQPRPSTPPRSRTKRAMVDSTAPCGAVASCEANGLGTGANGGQR